jgi:phospholipid transport system substrate-binding protein
MYVECIMNYTDKIYLILELFMPISKKIKWSTNTLSILAKHMLTVAVLFTSMLTQAIEVKASATALFSGLEESLGKYYSTNQLTLDNVKTTLRHKLLPASNTKYFAYKVIGKNLVKMNEKQKLAFIEALTQNLINSYASILVKYRNEKIVIAEPKIQPSGKIATVAIELRGTEKKIKAVSKWRFSENLSTWQIFDIVIEGVSLLQSKQAEINSSISRNGIEATLDKLNHVNTKRK